MSVRSEFGFLEWISRDFAHGRHHHLGKAGDGWFMTSIDIVSDIMIRTLQSRRDAHLGEQRLVVRIIVALGLALTLMVGAWSTTHAESDLPSFESVTSIETGAEIGASVVNVGTTGPATTSDSGIRGAVTCLIGVLCTFLVFTLLRSFTLGARRLSLLTSRPFRASLMVQPREPESSFTPSLVELSISRT